MTSRVHKEEEEKEEEEQQQQEQQDEGVLSKVRRLETIGIRGPKAHDFAQARGKHTS